MFSNSLNLIVLFPFGFFLNYDLFDDQIIFHVSIELKLINLKLLPRYSEYAVVVCVCNAIVRFRGFPLQS